MAEETTHTKWWHGLISPQMFLAILAGFASLVIFWVNQNNTTNDVVIIKKEMPTKVDVSDFTALEARVSRQYEQFNKISERLTAVEKEAEYNRGLHDAMEQFKKDKK